MWLSRGGDGGAVANDADSKGWHGLTFVIEAVVVVMTHGRCVHCIACLGSGRLEAFITVVSGGSEHLK